MSVNVSALSSRLHPNVPVHTISGFSSGGDMAAIHLVVFSSVVRGAAIAGGAPYGCNVLPDHAITCQFPKTSEPWREHLNRIEAYVRSRAAEGLIDSPAHLHSCHVLLFSGSADSVVYPAVMRAVGQQLAAYGAARREVFNVPSQHAWVTDDARAHGCRYLGEPFINNCQFDLAGEALRHMFAGPLRPRLPHRRAAWTGVGSLFRFRQAAFVARGFDLASALLADVAYVFVPDRCKRQASCRVHVHYHGCTDSHPAYYANHLGFHEWAATNELIVLHPRALDGPRNEGGCWDWDGQTGEGFDTYGGGQLRTVVNMVEVFGSRSAEDMLKDGKLQTEMRMQEEEPRLYLEDMRVDTRSRGGREELRSSQGSELAINAAAGFRVSAS